MAGRYHTVASIGMDVLVYGRVAYDPETLERVLPVPKDMVRPDILEMAEERIAKLLANEPGTILGECVIRKGRVND